MTEAILIGIVSVIVLGIGTQWVAWRLRIPSILLLLVVGFLAGPVTGLLSPEMLQGDWLFAFVSLSIGIILFEGGLSLRLSEFKEIGGAVLNLITLGVLITWALAGLAAYYIVGLTPAIATLTGAIVTVTGPTVIIPLIRHVRPKGRIGKIAKWEGITIDPVGAVLAVLVLEAILLLQSGEAGSTLGDSVGHAILGLLFTITTSVGVSVLGAAFLVLVMYRKLVPDFLRTSIALMVVVATFALSNTLQHESGLLEVTLMGILLANQKYVDIRRIIEFKEDLQVLLIGSLFILLSARLDIGALQYINWQSFAFLAVLVLIVRPIAVFLSTGPTRLETKEKVFLSWLAPRGIVAAAVASLFAFRLEEYYPESAAALVPLIFFVIVGTVAIYGLSMGPLAKKLGLADPDPQGVLILGAHPWARQLGRAIDHLGFSVLMIDSNARNVRFAKQMGLDATVANALSESVLDDLDLSGIGKLFAMTPNHEINSLAALNFLEIFESNDVYQLAGATSDSDESSHGHVASHLRGHVLFEGQTFSMLSDQYHDGGHIVTKTLTAEGSFESVMADHDEAFPLLLERSGELIVASEARPISPVPGDTIVLFMPSEEREQALMDGAAFDRLLIRSHVLDFEEKADFSDIALQAAALLAAKLPITAEKLGKGFIEGARFGTAPIAPGFAIPHFRLAQTDQPELVIVRCKKGSRIHIEEGLDAAEGVGSLVYGLFFLVSPQAHPATHLKALAQIASRIDTDDFMDRWMSVAGPQELKESLIAPERLLSVDLADEDQFEMIGSRIEDLRLPGRVFVAFVGRGGELLDITGRTHLKRFDRVTLIGDQETVGELK